MKNIRLNMNSFNCVLLVVVLCLVIILFRKNKEKFNMYPIAEKNKLNIYETQCYLKKNFPKGHTIYNKNNKWWQGANVDNLPDGWLINRGKWHWSHYGSPDSYQQKKKPNSSFPGPGRSPYSCSKSVKKKKLDYFLNIIDEMQTKTSNKSYKKDGLEKLVNSVTGLGNSLDNILNSNTDTELQGSITQLNKADEVYKKEKEKTIKGPGYNCLYESPWIFKFFKGLFYRGCQNKTKSGRTCQNWSSVKPHNPSNFVKGKLRKKQFGLENHNYCRNPTSNFGFRSPWCYTTDPKKRWDFCNPK